ncbi:MAG: DsbA family protein [Hyphomonadaceae bacterium]
MKFLGALCFALLAGGAAPASAQTFNAQEQAEIRAVVRDYLVNNPEVLREALDALQTRVTAERVARAEDDPRDFSIGPRDAPVTIVEFFDYRCPYCMAALPWVNDVIHTRRDVRFVFKEMPIFQLHGDPAVEASRASIAAMPQGRYLQFHQALMNFTGELTSARIDELARRSGIDVPRMRRDMSDPEIVALLQDNAALATDLTGSLATPTFVINGHVVQGANTEELDRRLREATRQARTPRRAAR